MREILKYLMKQIWLLKLQMLFSGLCRKSYVVQSEITFLSTNPFRNEIKRLERRDDVTFYQTR